MISIVVPELGTYSFRLTDEQGQRLVASDVVSATPAPEGGGRWNLKARSRVGVARVGDIEIWIPPKLPVERLLYLAGYANNSTGWREEIVELQPELELVPAIAHALWRMVERALRPGLLQGYHTIEEPSMVLRGRLRESDQLRRHHGLPLPMEIRHDDFTVDIAENQILLAAITRILEVPRVDEQARRRLTALRSRLREITMPRRGSALPCWQPTRLNDRYQPALRLAEVVCRACSPDHSIGLVPTSGFLFNLATLFQDYLTNALIEALAARQPGTASPQHDCHLDEGGAITMLPDLVWLRRDKPAAVVDAKYKHEKPAGYPNADIYQMLAYCTALGLTQGHLVYAKGGAEPARHTVRHAGIQIICHAFDLAVPPSELRRQIAHIADELCEIEKSVA